MENFIDRELIARIRRSDEEAFYAFCSRHWKSLYVPLLMETGSEEKAFECVKELFADLWNRRRRLPDITTTVEEYIIANGLGKREKSSIGWNLINSVEEVALPIRNLLSSLGVSLGDKDLRYK